MSVVCGKKLVAAHRPDLSVDSSVLVGMLFRVDADSDGRVRVVSPTVCHCRELTASRCGVTVSPASASSGLLTQ